MSCHLQRGLYHRVVLLLVAMAPMALVFNRRHRILGRMARRVYDHGHFIADFEDGLDTIEVKCQNTVKSDAVVIGLR